MNSSLVRSENSLNPNWAQESSLLSLSAFSTSILKIVMRNSLSSGEEYSRLKRLANSSNFLSSGSSSQMVFILEAKSQRDFCPQTRRETSRKILSIANRKSDQKVSF